MARQYTMAARAAAVQRTREEILDAAEELFTADGYDRVTLGDVARSAGVSQQTVSNHFGGKVALYRSAIAERLAPTIVAARERAMPGDPGSVVAAAVEDYERTGDATFRGVALAERVPEIVEVVASGRRAHRDWVRTMFAPQLGATPAGEVERLVTLLALLLDVTTWHQLRRAEGLAPAEVAAHLCLVVEALLGTERATPPPTPSSRS